MASQSEGIRQLLEAEKKSAEQVPQAIFGFFSVFHL